MKNNVLCGMFMQYLANFQIFVLVFSFFFYVSSNSVGRSRTTGGKANQGTRGSSRHIRRRTLSEGFRGGKIEKETRGLKNHTKTTF